MRTLGHLAIVLTACGSSKPTTKPEPVAAKVAQRANTTSGDECEQVMTKSRFVIDQQLERRFGREATDEDIKVMTESCRAPEFKSQHAELMACVLAAAERVPISLCWDAQFRKNRDGGTVADEPKDERPEAQRYLERLAKSAKIEWQTNVEFTKGKVGPTPATKCGCPTPCPINAKLWDDRIWRDLELNVDEESRYQYTYESDGKTFKATAIGDLDCDGKPGIWTLTGVGDNYGAKTTTTPPPKGSL